MTDNDKFIGRIKNRDRQIDLILKRRALMVVWNLEVVQDIRPDLTDRQAAEVLHTVAQSHNPAIGINLRLIEEAASKLYPVRINLNPKE